MKTTTYMILRALTSLGLLALLAMQAQAQAQLVTYQFTGTKIENDLATDGIGDTIIGSLTLDLSAIPDSVETTSSGGQVKQWVDGDFSIDGMTATNIIAGTLFSGEYGQTTLEVEDSPHAPDGEPRQHTILTSLQPDGDCVIQLQTYSYWVDDGIATMPPDPWNPMSEHFCVVWIWVIDPNTGELQYGMFSLDTFTPMTAANITIDGCDTGIEDFTYGGQMVSEYLADFAADARNHGAFVRSVAKLTNKLKREGLITGKQKGTLVSCAAASSIGK